MKVNSNLKPPLSILQPVHEDTIQFTQASNHKGGTLIDAKNGAQNGFCMGISYYHDESYGSLGIHDDQEGFYVLQGIGTVLIGTQEFSIQPGNSFVVPAGVPHSIKKAPSCDAVKVLWCHGAV